MSNITIFAFWQKSVIKKKLNSLGKKQRTDNFKE